MKSKKTSKTAKLDIKLRTLFILSLDGDRKTYKLFFEEVFKMLESYFTHSKYKVAPDQRDDLIQESALKIHKYRSSYNPKYPITPWIYTIAKNTAIDNFNFKFSAQEFIENNYFDETDLSDIEKIELLDEVNTLLSELSIKDQELILLAKYYGLSTDEIHKKLGMSPSNIKVSIHRALKSLRLIKEGSSND